MAFGNPRGEVGNGLMAEINIIPLVDVMLVLLVIFIITAPLLTNAVKIDLPRADSAPNVVANNVIQLALDADGHYYWNGDSLDRAALFDRLRQAGQRQPVAELHIHADRNARYQVLAEVMSEATKDGIARIGFITDPRPADPP